MFTSEWAFTSDVINFGGQAVDGMAAYHSFNADCQATAYLAFKQDFEKRFGYQPSFATILAHDAVHLLITALEQDPDTTRLKTTLLSIGDYRGLQSDFRLDRYGDVKRRLFLTLIHDGRFKVVDSK
jgi:branched-chain amino acid transport system substrate-binding protein